MAPTRRAWLACATAPVLAVLLSSCQGSSDTCGWDLSTPEGVRANQDRLTEVHAWLDGHPGAPVPEPTSTFWRGECPVTDVPPPPVDEGH